MTYYDIGHISIMLTYLMISIITQSIFPSKAKEAYATPIYKRRNNNIHIQSGMEWNANHSHNKKIIGVILLDFSEAFD